VARTVVAVGLIAALAGCSSTTSGKKASTSPTPSDPAAQAVASIWWPTVDQDTKIQFGMPDQPQTQDEAVSQPGGPATRRTRYQVQLAQFLQVTVFVDSGVHKAVDFVDPSTYADRLVAAIRADGSTDVRLFDRKPVTVQGRPGLDFRLTYQPKPPKQGQPILLTRVVQGRHAMVTMQTFAALADVAPLLTLQTLQAKLVAGLTLP
jgi:hypothetical protein